LAAGPKHLLACEGDPDLHEESLVTAEVVSHPESPVFSKSALQAYVMNWEPPQSPQNRDQSSNYFPEHYNLDSYEYDQGVSSNIVIPDRLKNYRKRPCISRTFCQTIEAKNQGCVLSKDTSEFGVLKNPINIHKTY